MNEEQKRFLSLFRKELSESQIVRLIDVIDDLDVTAQELMDGLNVLDVVRNRQEPRVNLVKLLMNMSKALQDIISAKESDGESQSV